MLRARGILSLTSVAIIAVLAVPLTASASNFHSGSNSGTTYITGLQVGFNAFDLANGTTVKCTTVTHDVVYAGTTAGGEITLTPTYSGCTIAGQAAVIEMTGCTYFLATPTKLVDTDTYDAASQVNCPAGKSIHIKMPLAGCELTIPSQIPKGTLDLTNVTSAVPNQDDVLSRSTLVGIQYTTTGGACGAAGEAKYTGEITYKAYRDSKHTEQVDFWIL